MVKVYYSSLRKGTPKKGYWDYQLLNDLLFESGYFEEVSDFENVHGGLYVLPARSHADKKYYKRINEQVRYWDWVIFMLMGDEEHVFDYHKLKHPNMKIYLMSARPDKHKDVDGVIPNGYAQEAKRLIEFGKKANKLKNERRLTYFFAGQNTHEHRHLCIEGIRDIEQGRLVKTEGFTQGIAPMEYFKEMARAVVAPAPSGAVIPDTFRLYEALESGAVPIAENTAPRYDGKENYFEFIFGEKPMFPILKNKEEWLTVVDTINFINDVYPEMNNRVFAWWQRYKYKFVRKLMQDIAQLDGGELADVNYPTVLIPTSPIKKHPDISIIKETIESVRYQDDLKHSPIFVMIDGVREEQEHLKKNYNEYVRRLLEYTNKDLFIVPYYFNNHSHQAKMARKVINDVESHNILYVEHDTPLTTDTGLLPIYKMGEILKAEKLDMIRFNHEAKILDEHKHMTIDVSPIDIDGLPFIRTAQWSQRPHLARTSWYKDCLYKYFNQDSITMIEDKMHGVASSDYLNKGMRGWNSFKIAIYAPENMKLSYHIDGRQNEPKFEMRF